MTVFSSVDAARREGFKVIDYDQEYALYIMERDFLRPPVAMKMLAFARP